MTDRISVAAESDLQSGDRKLVTANGTSIGVFNVDGEYIAFENECLHQHGPVCTGKIQPKLEGEFVEPGKLVAESFSDTSTIACPWHGWEYDLMTGEHLGDSSEKLKMYPVVIEDGEVFVEIE